MRLLISDANILIDVVEGALTAELFDLPYRYMVPDLMFFDELEEQHGHLPEMGMELGELAPSVMNDAVFFADQYRRASRYDCLALALAKHERCPLLTGDRALKEAAKRESVIAVGTLWLVESMVANRVITIDTGCFAYDRMRSAGRRLPWETAERRLREIENGSLKPFDPFHQQD